MIASLLLTASMSLSAQAAEPALKVSDASFTITGAADKATAFTVAVAGTLFDTDGVDYELKQVVGCTLDLSADSLTCDGSAWIDGDESELDLSISSGKAVIDITGGSLKPSDAAIAAGVGGVISAIDSQHETAIKGWSWPDGGISAMFMEWILEQVLDRDDVLIYVDGYCTNCIDQ